jgi:hypothetical protein
VISRDDHETRSTRGLARREGLSPWQVRRLRHRAGARSSRRGRRAEVREEILVNALSVRPLSTGEIRCLLCVCTRQVRRYLALVGATYSRGAGVWRLPRGAR